MRLFAYYALHSLKNQVRKLLRTWVLLFVLACALLGGLIGFGAARLAGSGDTAPDEAAQESGQPLAELLGLEQEDLMELIAGGVVLAVLLFEALGADKSGGRIFLPADVKLLFPCPMKPQSVLLFRLTTQLGLALLASVYLLLQVPTLISSVGLSAWAAVAVVATWGLTVAAGKLLQTLLYMLGSAHPGWRARIRRGVYLLMALLAAGFVVYRELSGRDWLDAAAAFYNGGVSRWVPFWGWLKGIVAFAARGNAAGALACLAATLLGGGALCYILFHMRADFYEDAMARSEETAALRERARSENAGVVFSARKKDRSARLRRDAFDRGEGANVFFYKTMYNRFRFAHFGFLTRTAETYLAVAVAASVLCRYVIGSTMSFSVMITLAVLVFFRSLGNPLAPDVGSDLFRLVPESAYAKLFWSLLGGAACCLLDLLPAMLAAVLILGENPLAVVLWLPFILSVDLYSTVVGTFIGLSAPVAAGKLVKQLAQVLFLYFGLLPDAAVVALCFTLGFPAGGFIGVVLVNLLLAGVFFAVTPGVIDPGHDRLRRSSLE